MWVKICGITDEASAEAVIATAPDAIGLNFYQRSKRCVDMDAARRIVSIAPPSVTPIGLFVNHTHVQIREICESCGLRTIQLHGDETADFIAELREFEIIRAFRVGATGLSDVAAELEQYSQRGISLQGCLIDAQVDGAYGGTGHQAPWEILADRWRADWPPLILAGGLTAENVADAIAVARPWGVDVASGVETAPGQKDLGAVQRFISAARSSA